MTTGGAKFLPDCSVILCTHNPRTDYLTKSLNSLRQQSLPVEKWELLVVDNASSVPLANTLDLRWHPHHEILLEKALGLVHARCAGIRRARSETIVFVDDDNVLSPDYLKNALHLLASQPALGILSGSIEGEFESAPPSWLHPFLPFLAIRPLDRDIWGNQPGPHVWPIGAGMVLRKTLAEEHLRNVANKVRPDLGRKGGGLLAGEDTDYAYTAFAAGWGCGAFTQLRLQHLIPCRRLEKGYLRRLVVGVTESHERLALFHHPQNHTVAQTLRIFFRWLRIMFAFSSADREVQLLCLRGRLRARL
jgi:glycosyltransferase involved in cell wall biosynthesis